MTCGAHHHLKRFAAPNQWGIDKKSGKYAVRPLPGPHSKERSIPFKYIIARFLKVANTAKEVDYIIEQKMILVNGREVSSMKFPVGLFDVLTIKKTNQHFRVYLGANRKFKVRKITSDDARFRISKVASKHTYEGIPLTHTIDGYNFKFADPKINIDDTVKIDIATNKIVGNIALSNGNTGYVFAGPNAGRIGTITRIDSDVSGSRKVFLQDKLEKIFSAPAEKVMVIGEGNSTIVSLEEDDGIRLTAFEISNNKYAAEKKVEAEDD